MTTIGPPAHPNTSRAPRLGIRPLIGSLITLAVILLLCAGCAKEDSGFECYADDQCQPGEWCQEGHCTEKTGCTSNADCKGNRICVDGQCVFPDEDAGPKPKPDVWSDDGDTRGHGVDTTPECVPNCTGRDCGDDGCKGSCGECSAPNPFCKAGLCVQECEPSCGGKECGDDGCGGKCGNCAPGALCNSQSICLEVCPPYCEDMTGELGSTCLVSQDCSVGLVCSVDIKDLSEPKRCFPEGAGEAWTLCSTDTHCKRGFYCELISFTGTCQPAGIGEFGDSCADTGDCISGLHCSGDGHCGILGVDVPLFPGIGCESSSEIGGIPRVLFEIPMGTEPPTEFYRLPFPNDIRLSDGKLDLQGHPTGGSSPFGVDIGKELLLAMEENLTGFGTNPVVYFRFSADPKLNSIETSGQDANVFLVDLTDPNDLHYGKKLSFSWVASTGRGLHMCRNYLALHVPFGRPLKGGHTYAAILTTDMDSAVSGDDGELLPFQQDQDFATLIDSLPPTEAELLDAWNKYGPLREFLETTQAQALGISKASCAGAAVFTTYDPSDKVSALMEAVGTVGFQGFQEIALCEDDAKSPCEDGQTGPAHQWGCFTPHEKFYEIQGLVRVPSFQVGQPPYLDPDAGGEIIWNEIGGPVLQGLQDVCFSLTIPKAPAPVNGWPVVLYAHGIGGNYRSHVTRGIAEKLSDFLVWNSETNKFDRELQMATLGWDQVLHGPWRSGPSPVPPYALLFNFANPGALLGNFFQSVAEVAYFVELLNSWNDVAPGVVGVDTSIDSESVVVIGHSLGGAAAVAAIPYKQETDYLVLSATGGGLLKTLLDATLPVDLRRGLVLALQDENVGRTQPLLALLQQYCDAIDPANFAGSLFFKPIAGHKVNILHLFGIEDQLTTSINLTAFAQASRTLLAQSPNMPDEQFQEFGGVQIVDLPKKIYNGLTVEYPTPQEGGEQVLFFDEYAVLHYTSFIGTAVLDGLPVVVNELTD